MNKEQALQILVNVTALPQLNRADHQAVDQALQFIHQNLFLKEEKASEVVQEAKEADKPLKAVKK